MLKMYKKIYSCMHTMYVKMHGCVYNVYVLDICLRFTY